MRRTEAEVRRSDAGQIIFYLLVVLPLAISLTVLMVDVSRWQLLREQAQAEADRIAVAAARFLPDTDAAARYVLSSVAALADLDIERNDLGRPQLSLSSNQLRVALVGSQELAFSFLLPGPKEQLRLPVLEEASAQIVPGDYAIVFSDASSLRPPPFRTWGAEQQWPAARYFDAVSLPLAVAPAGVDYQRWATQSCFNPKYSALKQAAINMLDALSAVRTNRVAVLSSPADNASAGFEFIRRLTGDSSGIFSNWFDPQLLLSDEACLYFADPLVSSNTPYALPERLRSAFANSKKQRPCQRYLPGFPFAQHFPSGNLKRCFISTLSSREVLHAHAVRGQAHRANGSNLAAAIQAASGELLYKNREQTLRGNISARAKRSVIVLSDILPKPFIELKRFVAAGVRVLLIGFAHPVSATYEQDLVELHARQAEYRAMQFEEVYVADGPDELNRIILKQLAIDREVALRS